MDKVNYMQLAILQTGDVANAIAFCLVPATLTTMQLGCNQAVKQL